MLYFPYRSDVGAILLNWKISKLTRRALPPPRHRPTWIGWRWIKSRSAPNGAERLKMLASAGKQGGVTESVLLAGDFTTEMVASLALCGLATPNAKNLRVGGRSIEVVQMRITDAGRYILVKQDRATVARQPRAQRKTIHKQ